MARKPTAFFWTAPTKNVDGTDINYELVYGFEARIAGAQVPFEQVYVTPGSLNPDGQYTAPLSDMPYFELGKSYEVGLRAIQKDDTTNFSARTNTLTFTVTDKTPQPPLAFSVA